MIVLWSAVAVLSLVALLGWLFAWYNRAQLAKLQQRLEQLEQQLQSELNTINSGVIGIGQRVISAEKRINQLSSRDQQPADEESLPYSQAASMLERGADVDQLAERCGLTEAEAQLIAMMKQHKNHDSPH